MPAYNSRRNGNSGQEQLMRPQAARSYADYPAGQSVSAADAGTVQSGKGQSDLLNDIISGLDADKLLIAALLLLLMREGGDMRLILALGYILL